MIPDIKLHEILKSCLVALRQDYSAAPTPQDSILYYLLQDTKQSDTGKYKWFNEAVEIFITRDENHDKYLDTRLFFDRDRAAIPTIHIMLSGESKGKDGMGFDVGFNPETVVGENVQLVMNRQFDINANIVITSDNTFETIIIYHVMKSMLISLSTYVQLMGFINPVLGGRDININQDIVPNGVYARSLNFSAGYELGVPEACVTKIINQVNFCLANINGTEIEE